MLLKFLNEHYYLHSFTRWFQLLGGSLADSHWSSASGPSWGTGVPETSVLPPPVTECLKTPLLQIVSVRMKRGETWRRIKY